MIGNQLCAFERSANGVTCRECGRTIATKDDRAPLSSFRAPCKGYSPAPPTRADGPELGDALKAVFTAFGITEDRVGEARALFGLPPECGCPERQEQLNEWGRKVKAWWRGLS